MRCADAEALLSELIDDELPHDVRESVESHLGACDSCAHEYRALKRTVRFVRGNADTTFSPGTPGQAWSDFTRALVDESYAPTPIEVMVRYLADSTPGER